LDTGLAAVISGLAGAAGIAAEPHAAARTEIAIDALDIDAVRPFWTAILGYREVAPVGGGTITEIVDPDRIGPTVWFQQMDEQREQRNRIHIDVTVAHDIAERRLGEAIVAGGVLLSDRRAPAFWVLADPEGNEACVCTWLGREQR
ncbi:MAG: VOC family protein, partial [Acidimicrobiales bacterium]